MESFREGFIKKKKKLGKTYFFLFDIWGLKSVLMQRNFFLSFFLDKGKIQGYLPLILGVPTPKCWGPYPTTYPTKG